MTVQQILVHLDLDLSFEFREDSDELLFFVDDDWSKYYFLCWFNADIFGN